MRKKELKKIFFVKNKRNILNKINQRKRRNTKWGKFMGKKCKYADHF